MRYILLAHSDSPVEFDESSVDAITSSGELVDLAVLAHPSLGAHERDTGAPLFGYIVVECESMERARGIARTLTGRSTEIAIRPVMRAAGMEM